MKKSSKKIIATFSFASFLHDMGADMIFPIWPFFVTSILGANMIVLGFIDGLGKALVSISQALSGYLSDRFQRRKIFIWTGYVFGSISRIGYALSPTWQCLIPFKIIDRSGKMRGAPRDAIIADISNHKNMGKSFGILRAMDNLGAVFGVTASLLLLGILGYRKLFLVAAIPSLIGALLIFLVIKDKKTKNVFKGFSFKDFSPNLKLFLVLSGIFALGSFSYSFLLIFANDFGYKVTIVPIFYLLYTLVNSIFSYPFGRLADKVGRKPVFLSSYIFFGFMCLGFIFVESKWLLFVLFALYGLHLAAMEPVQRVLVSELSPKRIRASTLGSYRMVIGLCALPASIIAGLLWEKVGHWAPFAFSLAMTIIASSLLVFLKKED